MQHTVQIKPGDSVNIIILGENGSFRGKCVKAEEIMTEPKTRKKYERRQNSKVSLVISQYCNAIKTAKWHTGAPVSTTEIEDKLTNLINSQSEITLMGLSDKCEAQLRSVLPQLKQPSTSKAVEYALSRVVLICFN